jgi:very-short-patch-repair endonuclease
VDFACHDKKLVIEVDGSQHADRAAADARRTAFLNSCGYRVLRFWNNEVLRETKSVMEAIYAALCDCGESVPSQSPTARKSARGGGKPEAERS